MRAVRRVVVKHFGSTRNFIIWVVAVSLSVYFIDSFILTKDRLQLLWNGNKPEEILSGKDVSHTTAEKKVASKVDKPEVIKSETALTNAKCGLKQECSADKVAFYIESGVGRDVSPTICFNGNYIASKEKKNGHRGLNVATINDKTLEVEDFRYFDTYLDEEAMVRHFNLGVADNKIILVATQDEASTSLKESGKSWLFQFGSTQVERLGFRDSFVMIGQRGLTRGTAIEKLVTRESGKEFAEVASVGGCLAVPMGKLNPVVAVKEAPKPPVPGEELPNCGVTENCGEQGFPAHVYSGKGNSDILKICVGGKYVMAKGVNEAGRGFNIVVVDPKTKEVVRVGHFDTYAEDSSNLEIFLELLNDKDIVIAVTFDEASKSLNAHAHKLFEGLGSGFISKLGFRDAWGFVGQKGMDGYSAFEELEFAGPPGSWPKSIDKHYCIPTMLKGTKVVPDKLPHRNEKKRSFCAKFDGYGEFCTTEHVDDALTPAPLVDKNMENHLIYNVPIIVIPGLNHNSLRLQLEALLLNPGVKVDMVNIMYDEKFEEPAELAAVFGFNSTKLDSSTKYINQMHKAVDKMWQVFPKATMAIVLEEDVIPSPDLLCYFSQCLTLPDDKAIAGYSAWNPNGYKDTSGAYELIYRVDVLPGFGFMLKKSFYEQQLQGKWDSCCLTRSWDNWVVGDYEMIVPDMSRVFRRLYEGLSDQANYLAELFARDRMTSTTAKCTVMDLRGVTSDYEQLLADLVKASTAMDITHAADCLSGKGLGFYVPATRGKIYAIYFEQKSQDDFSILAKLCKCFKLFYLSGHKPLGIHKGVIRFYYSENQVLFIGSLSPYFQHRPSQAGVVADKQ